MDKRIIIVDLDGTLSDYGHRIHLYKEKDYDAFNKAGVGDRPIENVCNLVRELHSEETHLSLTLPTTTGHMTDEMAGDMLGLNSELSDIAKAIEEIGNITHSEASNSTTQHSASGKDEIDTAAAAAVRSSE